jgi:hypothetical protein
MNTGFGSAPTAFRIASAASGKIIERTPPPPASKPPMSPR